MLLYGGAFCGIFTVVCAKCISRTGIRTGKRKPCVNMNTERFAEESRTTPLRTSKRFKGEIPHTTKTV